MAGELLYSVTYTDHPPIAVASIAGIEKTADGTTFQIKFHLSSGLKRIWDFPSLVTRDAAYTHIITQYGWSTD